MIKKKILIVVDMQNDFIDGSLGTKEAESIVEKVQAKIEQYKKEGQTVIFTRDTHKQDYLSSQEGKNLPIEHCIEFTDGWKISDKLDTSGCEILNKYTFGHVGLPHYISNMTTDMLNNEFEIELVGLCTDICVISNALILKANFTETPITVDASCCAGVTPYKHKCALETMKSCQINIINEEE